MPSTTSSPSSGNNKVAEILSRSLIIQQRALEELKKISLNTAAGGGSESATDANTVALAVLAHGGMHGADSTGPSRHGQHAGAISAIGAAAQREQIRGEKSHAARSAMSDTHRENLKQLQDFVRSKGTSRSSIIHEGVGIHGAFGFGIDRRTGEKIPVNKPTSAAYQSMANAVNSAVDNTSRGKVNKIGLGARGLAAMGLAQHLVNRLNPSKPIIAGNEGFNQAKQVEGMENQTNVWRNVAEHPVASSVAATAAVLASSRSTLSTKVRDVMFESIEAVGSGIKKIGKGIGKFFGGGGGALPPPLPGKGGGKSDEGGGGVMSAIPGPLKVLGAIEIMQHLINQTTGKATIAGNLEFWQTKQIEGMEDQGNVFKSANETLKNRWFPWTEKVLEGVEDFLDFNGDKGGLNNPFRAGGPWGKNLPAPTDQDIKNNFFGRHDTAVGNGVKK